MYECYENEAEAPTYRTIHEYVSNLLAYTHARAQSHTQSHTHTHMAYEHTYTRRYTLFKWLGLVLGLGSGLGSGFRIRVRVRVTWSARFAEAGASSPVVHITLITLSATHDPGSAAEDAGACWSETPLPFRAPSMTLGLGLQLGF